MSNKKLKFAVEDFSVEENPSSHFAILDMKIVSSGMNAHRLPITEDAVKDASTSLFGKPVLTHYIEDEDALGGHDEEEIPVGVFLDNDVTIFQELDRTWMSARAYVWKKYFPHVVNVFKKNNGKTNISMEIEVLESNIEPDGFEWIKKFCFLGVTAIGVTPAIFGSGATVLQFSDIVEKASAEFASKYDSLNFKIPDAVKGSAQEGLELRKKTGKGGTSVGLATARYLIKNKVADPKKVRHIAKYFPRHADDNLEDKESNGWIAWQLWGGDAGRKWASSLVKRMNALDEKQVAYFISDEEDKNILGLSEENSNNSESAIPEKEQEDTDKQAMDKKVEKEEKVEEEKFESEAPAKEEEKAEEEKFESEAPAKEEETPAEEAKEEPAESEEKTSMSLDAYADVPAMMSMLGEETEQMKSMFAELGKEHEKDFATISAGLYFMLKKFAEKCMALEEDKKQKEVKMAELEKFKADSEKSMFESKIEYTLKNVAQFMTPEDSEVWKEKAIKEFSLQTVDAWEKEVKASLFASLTEKINKEDDDTIVKMSLPFNEIKKQEKYIW